MEVKHLSFDLWGTIFKSNPQYSEARSEIILTSWLNTKTGAEGQQVHLDNITSAFKRIGERVNAFEYATGYSIPYQFKHHLVMYEFGIDVSKYGRAWLSMFKELAISHPPKLIDESIPDLINNFRAGQPHAISIVSNTQFITGSTLLSVLKDYRVDTSRIQCFFSDEIHMCKPNPILFHNVALVSKVNTRNIMHIGDNVETDIFPAKYAGMETHLCTNRHQWATLKERLYGKNISS